MIGPAPANLARSRRAQPWTNIALVLAFVLLALLAGGCHIPKIFGGHTVPPQPVANTAGEASTFKTLAGMAWWAFVPGALMMVASIWIPLIRKMGMVLLGIGVAAAVTPLLLDRYGDWAALAILVAAILWFTPMLLAKWGLKRRLDAVQAQLAGAAPEARDKHLGAFVALSRALNPKADKAFRRGSVDALSFVQPVLAGGSEPAGKGS